MTPTCSFVNTFYQGFLDARYAPGTQLATASYAEQLSELNQQNFGDSDFYSAGLARCGWDTEDLIVNALPLQHQWARERGIPLVQGGQALHGWEIAAAQIHRRRPDVVYIQDLNSTPAAFLDVIRPLVKLVVGQIATPIVSRVPFDRYDILVSSFPHYVEKFREAGLTAYYQPLAFSPRVLDDVGNPSFDQRDTACSFVGGISSLHIEGNRLLQSLAELTPTRFWGYGVEHLAATSPIVARHGGTAWGNEMFSRLAGSRITINRHGEIAGRFANNMRLFEATGCGALLITDHKDNLDDLFRIGEEVVAYRSHEECVALVSYFVEHPEAAAAIARAGQERTLSHHTYDRRMAQTSELLERHLRGQSATLPTIDARTVSLGHRIVKPTEVSAAHLSAWKSEAIPPMQRALVEQELTAMYRGQVAPTFSVLAKMLRRWLKPDERLIEVGCASGYYWEILEYLMGQRIDYVGVDYSDALIAMAREYYPSAQFVVADGAALPFEAGDFAVALSGGVLLHTPEWRRFVAETARVAERAAVFHRTPVTEQGETRTMTKLAYGVETVELVFSEPELLTCFEDNGLILRETAILASDAASDTHHKTYLCQKGPMA